MEQEMEQAAELTPFDVNDFFRPSIWQDKLARGRDRYQTVKSGIQSLLGVAMVRLTGNDSFLEYELAREDDVPVSLLQLLHDLPTLPEMAAIMGVAEDGAPLLVDLRAPESAHLLIAGETGAGKTMLLRSMLLSLATRQRQAQVQMVLLDGSDVPGLAALAQLPHALGPAVSSLDDVAETLTFLVNEMGYRQDQGVKTPALVVAIDEVEQLLAAGGQPVVAPLMRLLQKGAPAGIHLLLTTANPAAPLLDNVLKAAIPLRVVGRLPDAEMARAAAGRPHSQAEYLQGQGDFVAVTSESLTLFQGAYVGQRASAQMIRQLSRASSEKLLAFPIDPVTGALLPVPEEADNMSETAILRDAKTVTGVIDLAEPEEDSLPWAGTAWVDEAEQRRESPLGKRVAAERVESDEPMEFAADQDQLDDIAPQAMGERNSPMPDLEYEDDEDFGSVTEADDDEIPFE